MIKTASFIHGIFPRSEQLIKASRDFDRQRASQLFIKQKQVADRKKLINLQQQLGFSYIEGGMLNWQDIFRPLCENSSGLKTGSLIRYFDNNTFVRQPIITSRIKFKIEKILKYFYLKKTVNKVTLPSFFYLAKTAENNYYRKFLTLLTELAKEYNQLAKALEKKGIKFIQLNDPWIVYHQVNPNLLKEYQQAIQVFKQDLRAKIGLHTFFGSGAKIFGKLLKFPLDAVGLDFYQTSLDDLSEQQMTKALIAGILDARSPIMENKAQVKKFINLVKKRLNPKKIYLTTNSDLEFVTCEVSYHKLKMLGRKY